MTGSAMAECEDYVSPVEQQMRKQGRGGTAQQQQPQQQEDGEEVVVGVRLGELQRLRAAVAHDKEATALLMELMRRTPLSATQMQTQTQRTRADTVEERVSFAAAVVGAKQSAAATAVGVQHQQQRSAATSAASLAAGTTVTSEPRSRGLSLDEIGSGSETEEEQVLSLHLQQTHDEGRKASGKPPSTSAAPVRPTSVVTSVPAARELAARLGLREKFLALFSNRTDQQQQQVPVYRLELAILDVNATPAQRRAVGELKMRLGHTSPHETITAADVAELYPCTFQPVNTGNNDSSSGNSSGAESVALHGQESRRSALKLYAFYVIRDWSRKRASSSSSGNGKETGRHRHNNKEGNNGKFRWQPMPTDALMNSMDTLMGGDLRRFIQDGITLRAELFRAGGFYVSSSRDMVGVWVGPHGNAGANINTLLNSTPGFFILSSSHGKVVHSAPSAAATAGAGAAATSAASASVPALGSGAYLATPLSTTSSMSVSEFAIAQPLNSVDGQEDGADADAESVLSAGSSTKSGSGSRRRGRRGRGSRERRSTSRNSNYSNSAKPGADGMPAVMPTAAGTETGAGAVTQQQPVTPVASHTTTTAANGMGLTATPPTHSFPGLDTTLDMGSSEDGSEDGYGVMPGFAGLRRGSMASVSSISSARTPGAASPTLPHHHAQQPMHPRLAGPPGFAGQPPAPRGLPPHVQQQQQQQQQQRRQFVQPNNLRGVAPPAPSLQASDADVQQQQQQQQQQQRQPQQQQQQQQRVYHEVPVTAMQFPAPLALPFAPTLSGSVVDGTANTMTLAASNRQQEQLQQQQALNFASVPSQHQDENTASANAWQPHAAKPW